MTESPKPFDQEAFSAEAKRAFCAENFLDWLSQNRFFRGHQHHDAICRTLVELHNRKEVDLLEPISGSQLGDGSGDDFWLVQDLYCTLIPELETHTDPLIDAVSRLVDRGGNDLASNRPNGAFFDWLRTRPEETKRLLGEGQQSSDSVKLLTFVLQAGATHSVAEYQAAAIDFLNNDIQANRLAGVTALGRIDTSSNQKRHRKSLNSLSRHALAATSGQEVAHTVSALLDVYARRPDIGKDRVSVTIEAAAQRPTPNLHYLLALSLGHNHNKFPNELQITIIKALRLADPSMKGVVDQIDFALSQSLSEETQEAIADCLQALLDHPQQPLNFSDLDSFTHKLITERPEALAWLIVRWLRFGTHRARLSLPSLFRHFAEDGYELKIALQDFGFSDQELIFISRKTLGYFLLESATAASILVSCLRASSSRSAAETISQLLFDPLMINFSGQARGVVERQAKVKGKKRRYLQGALKAHDEYLDGLRSVGDLPEMWPSASERQVQTELQRQQFARSFIEAEKLSVFANLVTRQTLLHGEGSVYYMRAPDGQLHRSESLMSAHGTSIEFPRFETIDPVRFQHLILRFRNETLNP